MRKSFAHAQTFQRSLHGSIPDQPPCPIVPGRFSNHANGLYPRQLDFPTSISSMGQQFGHLLAAHFDRAGLQLARRFAEKFFPGGSIPNATNELSGTSDCRRFLQRLERHGSTGTAGATETEHAHSHRQQLLLIGDLYWNPSVRSVPPDRFVCESIFRSDDSWAHTDPGYSWNYVAP